MLFTFKYKIEFKYKVEFRYNIELKLSSFQPNCCGKVCCKLADQAAFAEVHIITLDTPPPALRP
jgi:hypothetical protein